MYIARNNSLSSVSDWGSERQRKRWGAADLGPGLAIVGGGAAVALEIAGDAADREIVIGTGVPGIEAPVGNGKSPGSSAKRQAIHAC